MATGSKRTAAEQPKRGPAVEGNALAVIAWCAGILALIAAIAGAKLASGIVGPTVLAGLLALTLTPLVAALERRGLPVVLASAVVVGCCAVALVASGSVLAPSADEWRQRAPTVIRSLERQFRNIEREIKAGVDKATAGKGSALGGDGSPTEAVIESGKQLVADVVLAAPEMLMQLIYVAFLCFFLMAERATLRRFVLSNVARPRMRLRLSRAMRDMRQSVGHYLLTITVINAALGACSAVVFALMGLPSPALWGTVVALLNFMPYIGPMIANLIILAVGLTAFNDVAQAIYVVLSLAVLNLIEGQVVTPMTVGRRSQAGPLAVFLALAFGAWLWGPLGALVSTPLLIVGIAVWHRMVKNSPLPRSRRPAPTAEGAAAEAEA